MEDCKIVICNWYASNRLYNCNATESFMNTCFEEQKEKTRGFKMNEPTKTLKSKEGSDGCTYYLDFYEQTEHPFRITRDEETMEKFRTLIQAEKAFKRIR